MWIKTLKLITRIMSMVKQSLKLYHFKALCSDFFKKSFNDLEQKRGHELALFNFYGELLFSIKIHLSRTMRFCSLIQNGKG